MYYGAGTFADHSSRHQGIPYPRKTDQIQGMNPQNAEIMLTSEVAINVLPECGCEVALTDLCDFGSASNRGAAVPSCQAAACILGGRGICR